MSKTKGFLSVVAVAAMVITFSCSSDSDSGGGGAQAEESSSSVVGDTPSSSSEVVTPLSSGEAVQELSSSSVGGDTPSSSSEDGAPLSSGEAGQELSSSSVGGDTPSSSSEAVTTSSSSEVVTPSSSSDVVTPSSSSEAGQELSSSSAVPGGGSSSSIVNASIWYAFTDVSNDIGTNGTSTIGNAEYADGKYIALVQENGEAVAKIQNYTLGRMIYGTWGSYHPFVGMGLEINNKGEYWSLSSCENGFSYKYKGVTHRFDVRISLVTNYNYHKTMVYGSSDWTTANIPFSYLKQENWDGSSPFDLSYLMGMEWQVNGETAPKTGSLEVKDVKCLEGIFAYCDYGPITEYGGGCSPMATNEDAQNCARWGHVVESCPTTPPPPTCVDFEDGTEREHYGKMKKQFCDERDGKKYVYVVIGTQTWMAENLTYDTGNSPCYNNQTSNCATYGRLYDWETAMETCPSGWHLPSNEDWQTLVDASGGEEYAGRTLKSATDWKVGNNNGTDNYGFSALPGGKSDDPQFYDVGDVGYWWSASALEDFSVIGGYYVHYDSSYPPSWWQNGIGGILLFSVRCVQD